MAVFNGNFQAVGCFFFLPPHLDGWGHIQFSWARQQQKPKVAKSHYYDAGSPSISHASVCRRVGSVFYPRVVSWKGVSGVRTPAKSIVACAPDKEKIEIRRRRASGRARLNSIWWKNYSIRRGHRCSRGRSGYHSWWGLIPGSPSH